MTAQEMHDAFDQLLQKNASNVFDNFLDEEIDYFLNRAQLRFIKDRYSALSNMKGKGFDQSWKRMDDLRTLVTTHYELCDTALVIGEGDIIDNPPNYLLGVRVSVRFRDEACGVERVVPARVISKAVVDEVARNPFSKSSYNSPITTFWGEKIEVYGIEKTTLLGVYVTFIRIPQEINVTLSNDCELPVHTHEEIVDLAVQSVLETIESPRFQSKAQDNIDIE